jgi:serine protease AprX
MTKKFNFAVGNIKFKTIGKDMTTIKYWRYALLLCGLGLFANEANAQRSYDLFWVGFADKTGSEYSIFRPQDYLSARAVARRAKSNILIDSTDLPVSTAYLNTLRERGLQIHGASRWFNGAVVVGTQEQIDSLKIGLKFVTETRAIGFSRVPTKPALLGRRDVDANFRRNSDYYGAGANQIKMLNGHYLQAMGWRGTDMQIAVFDGGFIDLRETPVFYSLFERDLVLGTRDFVEGDDFVYEADDHGRDVASTMAANIPNLLVGTAPDASYYFIKTEDAAGEYIAEEYYWLLAAEYSDSLGVDVINSSLGYAQFDDKRMSHAYVDLDGKTTPITRAAALAANKGILVVTSAGNEGNEKWKYITAPGDAPNVLTVGAVDRDGFYANLSSLGFASQPYIKPDIAARGLQAVVATKKSFDTRYSSGTSFSSPIVAGMTASLWQAVPDKSNLDIMAALRAVGDQKDKPDYKKGYGIADYYRAYQMLSGSVLEVNADSDNSYLKQPNDISKRLDIFIVETQGLSKIEISLYNTLGELVFEQNLPIVRNQLAYCNVSDWDKVANGVYYLYIRLGKKTKRVLLAK